MNKGSPYLRDGKWRQLVMDNGMTHEVIIGKKKEWLGESDEFRTWDGKKKTRSYMSRIKRFKVGDSVIVFGILRPAYVIKSGIFKSLVWVMKPDHTELISNKYIEKVKVRGEIKL